MNLSWANQLAKTALKTAQQKIDSVLDIKQDEAEFCSEPVLLDDDLLNSFAQMSPEDNKDDDDDEGNSSKELESTGDEWANAWKNPPAEPELVVDSEPNPIRDEGLPPTSSLLDHSPSSNSSDAPELSQSPVKIIEGGNTGQDSTHLVSEYVNIDLNILNLVKSEDSACGVQGGSIAPELVRESRPCSRHEDSLTVASSDIEVIKNIDAWSVSSSKPTTDNIPTQILVSKSESPESFRAQMIHAEQRRNELKRSNDNLQKSNAQLQQRIVYLNQQQSSFKKEIEVKKVELDELLAEGKRLADHSGKQSREIRRLKNEMKDYEKIKAERKHLREEKSLAEETIHKLREEIDSFKVMVHSLEIALEQRNDSCISSANNELIEKYKEEQAKRIESEENLRGCRNTVDKLGCLNEELTRQVEEMKMSRWVERVVEERANESVATANFELVESRSRVERLTSELRDTEKRLEKALQEKSNVAETISLANLPLLDEINELKLMIRKEQSLNEEADLKMQQLIEEHETTRNQLKDANYSNDLIVRISQEKLSAAEQRILQLENEIHRLRNEMNTQITNLKNARKTDEIDLNTFKEQNKLLVEEVSTLRMNLKEFKDENDLLKKSLADIRRSKQEHSTVTSYPNQHKYCLEQSESERDLSGVDPVPFTYSLTSSHSSTAAEVELGSLSTQYEMSLKRVCALEKEVTRCKYLERKIEHLQKELKKLNTQYNELLEVDGERLERIEELQQDIIDLRQLLKDQLLALVDETK